MTSEEQHSFAQEEQSLQQELEISDNSTSESSESALSPKSTPSPQSANSPTFRDNPINPDLSHNTSILGLNPETISQQFHQSTTSSISTVSSLTSSNPLTSPPPKTSSPKSPHKAPSKMTGQSPTAIHELPIPGSKFAPRKFTGKYHRAKRFTDHYQRLIKGITGMTDEEKCESMMQYCSTKVSDFLEQIDSYTRHDFNQLIKDIHEYYDVQLSESRWKEKDLIKFIKQYKGTKIKTLSQWKAYNRRFLRIANWLLNKGLIDQNHYRTYFWDGISKDLQAVFETRMLNKHSTLDFSKPFKVEDINKIAEQYFMRDKFAALVADSDDSDSGTESFESTDDEDSSDSSDSDDGYKKRKKHAKMHSKAKRKVDYYRKKFQAVKEEKEGGRSRHEPESSTKKDSKTAEIDDLIDQLQKMSVDSPAYGIVYYKATRLDRTLHNCLKRPVTAYSPKPAQTYQQRKQFKPGERVFHVSPTNANDIPLPHQNRSPLFNPTNDDRCFGCGGRGHPIRSCQKVTELMNAGIIIRPESSRQIMMSDGSYIRKQPNETLVQAAERIAEERDLMNVQCAMIRPVTFFYDTTGEYDSDTESDNEFEESLEYPSDDSADSGLYSEASEEEEDESESDDDDGIEDDTSKDWELHGVYEIGPQKGARQTRSARQRITDKFSAMPRGKTDKMKKKAERNMEHPKEVPVPVPSRVQPPRAVNAKPQEIKIQQPSRIRGPVQLDEDIEMQDQTVKSKPAKQQPKQNNTHPSYPTGPKPYVEVPPMIPRPKPVPASESPRELRVKNQIPQPIPINARTPRKIQLPDEEELRSLKPVSKLPKKSSRVRYEEDKENRQTSRAQSTEPKVLKRPGRKSELSSKINDSQIIDKLLEASVPLKISELLAVSPRVANSVSDLMKPKNQASLGASTAYGPNHVDYPMVNLASRRALIRVLLKTDGGPLNAIVDTGSQINVVNKKHCGTIIKQPIKPSTTVGMQDASGRCTKLTGLIEQVPLNCGTVKTAANLYVGENLPFDLLLGRPWQRGNKISIDEREDGTYLIFKHRNKQDMELLVDKSNTDSLHLAPEGMTSMVFSVMAETDDLEDRTSFAELVPKTEEITPERSDLINQTDAIGRQPDKITEDSISAQELIEKSTRDQSVQNGKERLEALFENKEMVSAADCTIQEIMKILEDTMKVDEFPIMRLLLLGLPLICRNLIFSVYKELVHEVVNRPPNNSSADPKTCGMNCQQPFPQIQPLSDRSNFIKPLSIQPPTLPPGLDFNDRVKHASDMLLDKNPSTQPVYVPMQIVSEYNVPQTLESNAGTLISGACLGAGLYQENTATGERTLMAGNMIYSFLPTCQLFYQAMNTEVESGGKEEGKVREPEDKVRANNDPWMGHRETGLELDTPSHCSSEGPYPSPTSSSSLNSILNLGPLTTDDISAAERQVNAIRIEKSLSPLYDDFIKLDDPEDIATKDSSRSCSPVVRNDDIINDSVQEIHPNKSDNDYEHIYGPTLPTILLNDEMTKGDPLCDNIPSVPIANDALSATNVEPVGKIDRCSQRDVFPPRYDSPYPTSGKVVPVRSIKKETSPPIEEPPFTGTGLELVTYYQILLAEQKRRYSEAFPDDEDEMDSDNDVSSIECNNDGSNKASSPNGGTITFNNGELTDSLFPNKKCIVCCEPSSPHCDAPCKKYNELTASAGVAQGNQGSDPPMINGDRKVRGGRCCMYSPHPGQNAAFQRLVKEVKGNAFTKVQLDGTDLYNYLYRRGGGALVVKEATTLRTRLLDLIYNLVDEVMENGWKTHHGEIREDCYRRFPGGTEFRLDPHYILPSGFRSQLTETANPFLFPAEELCLKVVWDLFQARNCFTTLERIDYAIHILSPYQNIIRQWLQHGILGLDDLTRFPDTYAPAAMVEIDAE